MTAKKIIIDTDCGVDDALAILLAATTSDVQILAITCCYGNTSLSNVWKNVFRVLTVVERTQIPVFVGCERSLIGSEYNSSEYHGGDGFGGVGNAYPIPGLKPQQEHASNALVRLVNSEPGKITLVALGPLTNLAVAQRLDASFSSKLHKLVYMGGNIEGKGNTSPAAEFNFYCDPEAASVVLKEFECPMICVSWEICLKHRINWDDYHKLVAMNTKKSKFMHDISQIAINRLIATRRKGYHSCDLFAMAAVVDDKIVTETTDRPVSVELRGTLTRGQMVVDCRPWSMEKPNVTIVTELDDELLLKIVQDMLM